MRNTNRMRRVLGLICLTVILGITFCGCTQTSAENFESNMYGTFWALVPPIVAIGLALITKEVHSSLFVGIVLGSLFATNFNVSGTLDVILTDGFIAALSDSWNVGIILFLVLLGIMVALVNKAGGSTAYGEWAKKNIKTRVGAILSTFALGVLIFVDDYFNCLTVGSVMRPVSDSHRISRAKLAYIIDATAAPICMIAPISSWAAAVSGFVEGYNGLTLFIRTIPYNFYSLMTIVMILTLTIGDFDFGPMAKYEQKAKENGDLFGYEKGSYKASEYPEGNPKGGVIDLLLPIIVLIVSCIIGMIYTGGFFDGENFIDAFANCDASYGLPLGAGVAIVFTIVFFMIRGTVSFKDSMDCIPEGFKAMVPPILILSFAWTLCNITGLLGAADYVAGMMESSAGALTMFLPAIIFVVAAFLAFSTGTSWGTFGILIPIVVALYPADGVNLPQMLVICISACCAGGVCGDHCSPISDTTIMASTGAQCDHVVHVNTQLPYALTAVALSFVGYLIAGITQNPWISLGLTTVITLAVLLTIRSKVKKA